jgi:hypothetical protein
MYSFISISIPIGKRRFGEIKMGTGGRQEGLDRSL